MVSPYRKAKIKLNQRRKRYTSDLNASPKDKTITKILLMKNLKELSEAKWKALICVLNRAKKRNYDVKKIEQEISWVEKDFKESAERLDELKQEFNKTKKD